MKVSEPAWINKELEVKEISKEESEELENILKELV